jgi:hypothetical protein
MSDSSGSALDLLVAPLPLTPKHRDELDEAILERVSDLLDEIPNPAHTEVTMALSDWTCRSIVMDIIQETSYFLKRENLKNVLRVDIDMKNEQTLQEHPQLRDIIRVACQTRSNFTRIADLSELFVYSIVIFVSLPQTVYADKLLEKYFRYPNRAMPPRGPRLKVRRL